jgi:glycosyltransferase involved in cell wall biosynthesis
LSVVIVARNEGRILPRCLASVHGWVDEIIVALNGTTDDSAAVAARFGAAVHTLEWRGYRDTKNDALALARHPWVLCLDADEEVSGALRRDIEAFFTEGQDTAHAGARFPRKVWFIDRWITHGDWYPDLSLRLIDRRVCGRIDNDLRRDGAYGSSQSLWLGEVATGFGAVPVQGNQLAQGCQAALKLPADLPAFAQQKDLHAAAPYCV